MFSSLLENIYISVQAPFSFLETLFGSFGLSFLVIFTAMIAITFFVRNFIRVFFSPHI